jgi:dihydropyrimidinase
MKDRTVLIINGTVVTAETSYKADLLIRGEKIKAIGEPGTLGPADQEIDAEGLLVLPGLIDPHVHFEKDEFMGTKVVHDFDTGTYAGIFGGVTTIIEFYNQKLGESLFESLEKVSAEAEGLAYVDWSYHATITDPTEETLADIPRLIAEGVPTFKCYTTYREDGLMVEDIDLLRILQISAEHGGMVMIHTEDDALSRFASSRFIQEGKTGLAYYPDARPREIENASIRRVSEFASFLDAPIYIVHMSTLEGAQTIARAREAGTPVWGETCVQYLVLDDSYLRSEDAIRYFCNPPLRTQRDQAALWDALATGRLSVVSTDDSAFTYDAKLMGKDRFDRVPAGLHGIETRLPLLYSKGVCSGRISVSDLVAISSTNVAKLFGLFPQKGLLSPGSDADIVLFDPERAWTLGVESLHMVPKWSPFEGWEVQGKAETVISRGEVLLQDGRVTASPGRGRRFKRRIS